MGKTTNEFKANALLFAIVGAGIPVAGGLLYMNNQIHDEFTAVAQNYDAFMVCVPTKTPAANANLVIYVPVEAQIRDADKTLMTEKLQHVMQNFSAVDYNRNVPALTAQASAAMLGLTRKLNAPIQISRGPLTSVCP